MCVKQFIALSDKLCPGHGRDSHSAGQYYIYTRLSLLQTRFNAMQPISNGKLRQMVPQKARNYAGKGESRSSHKLRDFEATLVL